MLQSLEFRDAVRLRICDTPVLRIDDALFMLRSRWPVEFILNSGGDEPKVLRNAKNACMFALVKRTRQSIADARRAFVEAAGVAGILATGGLHRASRP